ncbi:MAG: hypothetical protein ACK5TU_02050 [Cyclobacteriaceae bacterium]|jgi:hypothetical protein
MNPVEKYFGAEKAESFLFVLVGLVAITLAVYFFAKLKQPFYNGIAYPLIAIALIQITVGGSVYLRSSKDIARVNQMIQIDKTRIQTEEIPRMKIVMNNFVFYRWIEIVLVLIGLALLFSFKSATMWKGVGLGLVIQSALMLLLDFFAESRGREYLDYLLT